MNYYNNDTVIWRDGQLLKAKDATTDLYSASLHYGYCVFEGIRAYKTVNGETRIFKATQHFDRLQQSAASLNIPLAFASETLIDATYAVLEVNNLQDAYIRPIVYLPANMSFNVSERSHVAIEAWAMQPFLGEKLLRVFTSTYQRPNPKGFIITAKAGGHYVNSILASQEAKQKGYDEALLTDINGFVAEGPGANTFIEKDGKLVTPPLGNILPGITRATVLELCNHLNIPVEERLFTTEEMKEADAAFFCGTAAEIIGFESLDDYKFPLEWNNSVSRKIQLAYKDLIIEKTLTTRSRQPQLTGQSL